jgi:hypothetical protein
MECMMGHKLECRAVSSISTSMHLRLKALMAEILEQFILDESK